MKEKKRLDVILLDKNFVASREKAKALIMSGCVYVNNQKADKPGTFYLNDDIIEVRENPNPFVSRGGLKLLKAIKSFKIDLRDKVAMDIGASTGGFTDCMLQNGAKKVYSVDVGYGQLDWKLRNDSRVVNIERTNIRYIDKNLIKEKLDFISVDVAFISLKLVLPVAKDLMDYEAYGVCLIKPQFEAGREKVSKNGVVRDFKVHIDVIEKIVSFSNEIGLKVLDLEFSPIKGPKGNIEYLMYIKKTNESVDSQIKFDIKEIVNASHMILNEGE